MPDFFVSQSGKRVKCLFFSWVKCHQAKMLIIMIKLFGKIGSFVGGGLRSPHSSTVDQLLLFSVLASDILPLPSVRSLWRATCHHLTNVAFLLTLMSPPLNLKRSRIHCVVIIIPDKYYLSTKRPLRDCLVYFVFGCLRAF